MLKKVIYFVVTSLAIALFVLPVGAAGEKVKLTYWGQAGEVIHPKMVAGFETKYPNISIVETDYPGDKLRILLRTALAAGTGPDVVYFELGLGHVEPMIQANLITDLEEAAKKYGWKERIIPFALAEATHHGKLWAIPNEAECIVMYYHKDVFRKLGVTIPTSWDELIDICKKSEATGYEPIALSLAEDWTPLHRISLAYQWGGGIDTVRNCLFKGDSWNKSQFVEGLRVILELDKNYMPNTLSETWEEGVFRFFAGEAAMQHTGTWFTGDIIAEASNPDDFDIFLPMPPGAKEPSSVAGCGSGWYISSQCKNIDAALLFLNYAITDEAVEMWVKGGYVPTVLYDVSGVEVNRFVAKAVDFMSKYEMGYFIHHSVSPEQTKWIVDGHQGMVAGAVTPEQFVQKFEELAQKAKKEGFKP